MAGSSSDDLQALRAENEILQAMVAELQKENMAMKKGIAGAAECLTDAVRHLRTDSRVAAAATLQAVYAAVTTADEEAPDGDDEEAPDSDDQVAVDSDDDLSNFTIQIPMRDRRCFMEPIDDYQIQPVVPPQEPGLVIFVKTPIGKTITLKVQETDIIEKILVEAARAIDEDPAGFRLVSMKNGRELPTEELVGHSGLEPYEGLELLCGLAGGGWFGGTRRKIDKGQEAKDRQDKKEQEEAKAVHLKLLAKQIELEMDKWKRECINEAVLMQLKLEINKSNKDKGDPLKKAMEKADTATLAAAKDSYNSTATMSTRVKILARLLYGAEMQLLDKKIKCFESARKTAEMNTQLIYEKTYAGKVGGSLQTLPEVMKTILTEKISGKQQSASEDSCVFGG